MSDEDQFSLDIVDINLVLQYYYNSTTNLYRFITSKV